MANVDATAALAKQLGGRVYVEPVDVPGMGRFAVIADPHGAVLSLCALAEPMNLRDMTRPGEICWHELLSENHEVALAFYGKLFDWKKRSDFDMGPLGKYVLFGNEQRDLGGMFTKPKDIPYSAWNYYMEVSDLDAAVERATEKGATVRNGPMQVPSGARIALLTDPQGAGFCLHENARG